MNPKNFKENPTTIFDLSGRTIQKIHTQHLIGHLALNDLI